MAAVLNTEPEQQEIVLCKDCCHASRGLTFSARVSSWILDPDAKFLKCRKSLVEEVEYDYVSGKNKVERSWDYCSTQRKFGHDNMCGPQGINWLPRKKEDLFKLMKRI